MLRRLKFTRLKLASQFTLLLSVIFLGGIALGGLALSTALEQKAQAEVAYRGEMAMEIAKSVRFYTSNNVAPLIRKIAHPEAEFIPETIPSLATKQVFEKLRENWKYKDLIYKEATLNPTNMADQSDLFEAKLIERFNGDRTLQTLSGFRSLPEERMFYTAQPLAVTSSSCLKCHGLASVAPKSHVEKYGAKNGYGWELNQIIGTQIIYIPATEVFTNARKALLLFISIFIAIFALVIAFINYLLKWRVIKPLKPMAQLAEKISRDTVNANEARVLERSGIGKIAQRTDELGQLGRVFQKMVQEVCAREQQLSEQLEQLRVEIDTSKLVRQVAEIAETDYFQQLQKSAKEIRNQWTDEEGKGKDN
jgi:methyl-accepting chemotaxis protein